MLSQFPQPTPQTWMALFGPIVIHLVLLVLALAAVVGVLLRRKRLAQPYDLVIWLGSGILLTVIFANFAPRHEDSAKFIIGFVLFLWAVILSGIGVSFYRLNTKDRGSPVVVSVLALASLAILIALLLPAVPQASGAARRSQCKNNLKLIGLAMYNYHASAESLPLQQTGDPPQSWRLMILPYIEANPLYNLYHHDLAWDSPENVEFAKTRIAPYQCPSQIHERDDQDRWLTSYALLTGPQCIWREDGPLPLNEITDGRSNTIAVVEACGQLIVWNEPRDIDTTHTPISINTPGEKPYASPAMFSALHPNGFHVLLADGTVRFISLKIDPKILQQMITADAGDVVKN